MSWSKKYFGNTGTAAKNSHFYFSSFCSVGLPSVKPVSTLTVPTAQSIVSSLRLAAKESLSPSNVASGSYYPNSSSVIQKSDASAWAVAAPSPSTT